MKLINNSTKDEAEENTEYNTDVNTNTPNIHNYQRSRQIANFLN